MPENACSDPFNRMHKRIDRTDALHQLMFSELLFNPAGKIAAPMPQTRFVKVVIDRDGIDIFQGNSQFREVFGNYTDRKRERYRLKELELLSVLPVSAPGTPEMPIQRLNQGCRTASACPQRYGSMTERRSARICSSSFSPTSGQNRCCIHAGGF